MMIKQSKPLAAVVLRPLLRLLKKKGVDHIKEKCTLAVHAIMPLSAKYRLGFDASIPANFIKDDEYDYFLFAF